MKFTYILPLVALTLSCNVAKNSYKIKKDDNVMKYANTITAEELKQHLSVIASDEYEGRETGEKGQIMTAEYLKNEFIKDWVSPGNKGDYFQNFPLIKSFKPEASFNVHNKEFLFLEDFYFYQSYTKIERLELNLLDVVNLDHGIKEGNVDNYKDKNVIGKSVVISLDKVEGFESWNWRKKLELATKNGATTVFFTSKNYQLNKEKLDHYLSSSSLSIVSKEKKQEHIPFFFISNKLENEIFEVSSLTEEETNSNPSFNILQYNSVNNSKTINTSNVLGFIEGTDPVLKNEIIILHVNRAVGLPFFFDLFLKSLFHFFRIGAKRGIGFLKILSLSFRPKIIFDALIIPIIFTRHLFFSQHLFILIIIVAELASNCSSH